MKRYFSSAVNRLFSPCQRSETDAQAWAHSQSVDTVAGKLEQANTRKSAQTWGLTDEEWQRYQALMNGRRGVFSPDLDPITALGIEARTAEERRRFAELSVQQDFKRVEAELAFQREVDAAWKRLYPIFCRLAQVWAARQLSPGVMAVWRCLSKRTARPVIKR